MKSVFSLPKTRNYFFGCNTSEGFYTYFDFLQDFENARIFIVKGGPGTGKSNFIKNIGYSMFERGYNIEYQHCSLDPNSLDAVVLPDIKVVVVAATGHHVFDPQVPGAVDEILDLGMYWNEDGIRPYHKQIRDVLVMFEHYVHKSCRYLKASRIVLDNVATLCSEAVLEPKINKIVAKILDIVFGHSYDTELFGSERNLFVSSITPFGEISYLETFVNSETIILGLVGEYGSGKSKIINRVAETARLKGIGVEICHNPIDRHYLEHLFLPELNYLLTTKPHEFTGNNPYLFDLNEHLASWINEKKQEISEEKSNFQYLVNEAIKILYYAKSIHGKLEQFYIPNMDFNGIDYYRKKTENRILEHAKQVNKNLGR